MAEMRKHVPDPEFWRRYYADQMGIPYKPKNKNKSGAGKAIKGANKTKPVSRAKKGQANNIKLGSKKGPDRFGSWNTTKAKQP